MSFIKLALFQVRLYIKNTYFVNLVIIETTTMLLYEYLAHYVLQTYDGKEWLIAGVMGTWASCTTSAGALDFQRFQGTLPYLLNTGVAREKVLLATLIPASVYGLIAFPLAGLEAWLLKMPVNYLDFQLLVGIILLWIAAAVLSYFISLFFVLSKNAIVYEQLLLLPILFLSGLLSIPEAIRTSIKPFQMLSPLTLPIRIIYHESIQWNWIMSYILVVVVFGVLSKLMTNIVIKRAFKEGRLSIF